MRSEPPEASFAIADGWIQIRLIDAGKPMGGMKVTCLVNQRVWADGLTGENGEGSFPKPDAEYCQLIFDLGAGPSAPIPLTFLKDGTAVPTAATVCDGTAACCVLSSSPRHNPIDELPGFGMLGFVAALVMASAWCCLVILRRGITPADQQPQGRTKRAR